MKSTIIKWTSSLIVLLMISIQFSCQNNNIDAVEPTKKESLFAKIPSDVKRKIDMMGEAMKKYAEIEKVNRTILPSVEVFIANYLKEKGIDTGYKTNELSKNARMADLPPNDDEFASEGYNLEYTNNDLPWAVKSHVYNFESRISQLTQLEYNFPAVDDQGAIAHFQNVSYQAMEDVAVPWSGLNQDQTEELMTIFYYTYSMTDGIYNHVLNNQNNWDNGQFGDNASKEAKAAKILFFKKIWRAVARVVVAIVVTVAIVATVVATAGGIAAVAALMGIGKGFAIGGAIKVALLKGITIGTWKASAALATGAAAGLKNATKNWNKDWQGVNELVFGIKLKEVAVP